MGTFRTLLAIAVVLTHMPLGLELVGGRNAVQAFYMISGFLISYVIVHTPAYANPVSFWKNRALRIYPVYYVVLIVSLAASALNPKFWELVNAMPIWAKLSGMVFNLTILGQDWTEFVEFVDGKAQLVRMFSEGVLTMQNLLLIKPAWTLGVELSFYLIAPFIIRSPWRLFTLIAMSVIARLTAALAGWGLSDPWTYRFFPFELAFFIAGALAHQFCLPLARKIDQSANGRLCAPIVFCCVMAMSLFYAVVPLEEWIKTAAFLTLTFAALPFLFIFQSRSTIDRAIGELSYPLYISHYLVIMAFNLLLKKMNFAPATQLVLWIVCLSTSLIVAYLLKLLVSDQVEVYRRKIRTS